MAFHSLNLYLMRKGRYLYTSEDISTFAPHKTENKHRKHRLEPKKQHQTRNFNYVYQQQRASLYKQKKKAKEWL